MLCDPRLHTFALQRNDRARKRRRCLLKNEKYCARLVNEKNPTSTLVTEVADSFSAYSHNNNSSAVLFQTTTIHTEAEEI
jgi:hypothetical protein